MDRNRRKVRDLLRRAGVHRPPVPVERIAEVLGLEVRHLPSPDEISGALIRKGKDLIIGVNSHQHPNRQRFTIAHEIAHFVLHKGRSLHVDEDFCINRDGSNNLDEMQANRFAAELLMPEGLVEADVSRFNVVDARIVGLLASKYRVSSQAMQIRLSNLGYIAPF
ncbi:MAG: ImmA/IrrE family metallo-endopeptidase [Candidatus Sulfotelmatobacter sp.]